MRIPLRLRLTLTFAVGMAVVLTALGGFLYLRLGRSLLDSIDLGLRSRTEVMVSGIRDGTIAPQSGTLIDPDEAFAQILDPSLPDPIVDSSPAVSAAPMVSVRELATIGSPTFLERKVQGVEDAARLLVVPVQGGRYVVAGATLSDRQEAVNRFLVQFAIGAPVALALTSLAGWAVAGAALRPVERIRAEAAAISASEPHRRLPVPQTRDELTRLATTLNEMLTRLQDSLARERRLVDDASHELRTPLAVLKGELDLALSRARSPQELEAAVRRASAEADRLARLAEDLLVLARTEGGRLPLRRTEVSLAGLVSETRRGLEPRAKAAGVSLQVAVPDEQVRVDPVRLRQALENLVDNALRHTPPGGRVTVRAERTDDHVTLRVEDSGRGFPHDLLERVFEPFARDDAGGSGAGLGLAIVRTVAEAHGGTATAENVPGGGARVVLTLPI